jgi:hypothetical protein
MALTEHTPTTTAASGAGRTALLIAGDALAFLVFAALGRSSHGEAAGPSAILQVAETAAPFAIGWFAVAPLIGACRATVVSQPRAMLGRTALAWLMAWPIGLGLRALARHAPIPMSFAIVVLVTNMIILLGWRGLFAWFLARRRA